MTMFNYVVISFILFVHFSGFECGDICKDPKVNSNSYSTTDGQVILEVAFVSEMTVACKQGLKDLTLYADRRGKQIPAVKSSDYTKYQISWTENLESVFSGEYGVKIYDEEGNAALKKAQRGGEDVSSIPSAFFISLYHRGIYYGPWVSSETIALLTSFILFVIAFRAKSNLVA